MPQSAHRRGRARAIERGGKVSDVSLETRVGQRIVVQPNGCWLYNGNGERYAIVGGRTARFAAHRFVYEVLVGPIPEGHVLHHTCETPGCVNPKHLQPLTHGEHIRHHRQLRRKRAA